MAAADNPTELLPILSDDRGFDVAIRGYDRAQVEHYLARLDEEIRTITAERDATASRSADLAAQLASAHAQIESLRRQLHAATETVTADTVDARVKQILENAVADATATRTAAEQDAAATRAKAEEAFRTGLAEVEEHRAEVEARLAAQTTAARETVDRLGQESAAERTRLDEESAAERARLDAESAAERARLDEESAARRALADEDFEITLRKRRTAENEASARQRAVATTEAEKIVESARKQAENLLAEARADLQRLEAEREALHQRLVGLHGELGTAIGRYIAPAADGGSYENTPADAPADPAPSPEPSA